MLPWCSCVLPNSLQLRLTVEILLHLRETSLVTEKSNIDYEVD